MLDTIRSFSKDNSGATAIEYALLATLIGIALLTAFTDLGTVMAQIFQKTEDSL